MEFPGDPAMEEAKSGETAAVLSEIRAAYRRDGKRKRPASTAGLSVGPRDPGRRGNAGKWAPAPLEAAGGAPPPRETLEDACVEEGITSTAPSGRRNEPVDRAWLR